VEFAFDRSRHDRRGNGRGDSAWSGDTRLLVLGEEQVATVDGPALRWLTGDEAPAGERILLGEQGGRTYAAVLVDQVPEQLSPVGIRILAPLLTPDELSLAIHAVGVGRWLAAHRFCARCGGRLTVHEAGHLLRCPDCGAKHFPRTDPAVIMLITDDRDRALLARNAAWPAKRFSTLAGFVEPGETLEDAVRREAAEEVGVVVGDVQYAASQPWPFPSSLMVGFTGRATATRITVDGEEIAEAEWFTRSELVRRVAEDEIRLPPAPLSVSRWLIERWVGRPIG